MEIKFLDDTVDLLSASNVRDSPKGTLEDYKFSFEDGHSRFGRLFSYPLAVGGWVGSMVLGIQTASGEEAKKDSAPPGFRPVATSTGGLIYRKPDGSYYNPLTGENLRVANRLEQGGVVREVVQGIDGSLMYMFSSGSGEKVSIISVQLPKPGISALEEGIGGNLNDRIQDALLKTGKGLMEKGKYGEAIHYFEELTRRAPNNADHWERLGDAAFTVGDCSRIIAGYEMVNRLDPQGERPEMWKRLIEVFRKLGYINSVREYESRLADIQKKK